jgi:hypothetical protein
MLDVSQSSKQQNEETQTVPASYTHEAPHHSLMRLCSNLSAPEPCHQDVVQIDIQQRD